MSEYENDRAMTYEEIARTTYDHFLKMEVTCDDTIPGPSHGMSMSEYNKRILLPLLGQKDLQEN